jgi:hypothetical protein
MGCVIALAVVRCAFADGPTTQAIAVATQPAATEPSTQPSESVADLLKQLDDPEFGVRVLAESKLEEMGFAIEPDLKAALRPGISDEARARITHLIREFDEARAMHASITIHCTNAPTANVLKDFSDQAGATLGIDETGFGTGLQAKNITLNIDNASFWEGLRAICDATKLTPYVSPSGITLMPPGRMGAMPVDLTGQWVTISNGVLIEPFSVNLNRNRFFMGNRPATGFYSVQFVAIPEPRLHVIGMMGGNWVKECIDDKGNALIQEGFDRRRFYPGFMAMRGSRLNELQINANFREFPGMGTQMAKLKGELALSVQTQGLVTQIPDITRAANTTKDDGKLSVTVLACSRTNMNYELVLQVRGAMINDPLYMEFQNSLEMLDDKGQAIPRQSYVPRPGPDGVRLIIGFVPTQTNPATLRWERTLEQKRLTVPFEIDNLPLQ